MVDAHGKMIEHRDVEGKNGGNGGISISPSRFQALADISEEEEDGVEEVSETEEGEIVAEPSEADLIEPKMPDQRQRKSSVSHKGSRPATNAVKTNKKKIARSKDLKFAQVNSTSKKTSVRKL